MAKETIKYSCSDTEIDKDGADNHMTCILHKFAGA